MLRKHCVLPIVFLALFSSKCYASGDFGCYGQRATIFFRVYDSCNSVPFLSPSNDSRLNLELLLIDAGKLSGTLNATETETPTQYYQPARDLNWDPPSYIAASPWSRGYVVFLQNPSVPK